MVQSQKILITGAAGFVGTALCRKLHHQGFAIRALVRRGGSSLPEDLFHVLDDVVAVDDGMEDVDWATLLDGVDRVVHLAARAHAGGQSIASDLYFRDNLDMTSVLARAALAAQVKQFIFFSTIKVNGEGVLRSDHHHPYKVSDRPRPKGAYAVSKWRAEQELNSLFNCAGAPELIILRPPMIYADAVKGNSAFLQKWLSWGLPLPVPSNGNRRSLLELENLLEIITGLLSDTVRVGSKLLLPCDQEEWSTERLAKYLALKVGCQARILSVPDWLAFGLMDIINRDNFFVKIYGSLRIEKD